MARKPKAVDTPKVADQDRRPPQPRYAPSTTKATKHSPRWWRDTAQHEITNWNAQASWWMEHTSSSVVLTDSFELFNAAGMCWIHAMHFGVPNAAALGKFKRALLQAGDGKRQVADAQLHHLFAEADLAVEGLALLLLTLPGGGSSAPVARDLTNDPQCRAIRDIIRQQPKMLRAIEKDARCRSRRVASKLLAAMENRGMVQQTASRGPWRFVSDNPTK